MRISSAFPSDYLKASDLQGRAVTVTLSRVTMGEIGGDLKPILYFQNKEKGMVLNKTNANKISEIFGDDTDTWEGGEVTLYEAMVEFQGKTVPAIRIRMPPRKAQAQVINNGNVHTQQSPQQAPPATKTTAEIIDDDIPF